MLCLGAWVVGPMVAFDLLAAYLAAKFSDEEEFRRRVEKLGKLEAGGQGKTSDP